MKKNIIDKWLDKNGTKEIEKQVENEYKEIMKQTAVEWLQELIECGADLEQIKKSLPKAKEIEKQQIILSFNKGLSNWDNPSHYLGKEYYKETFNKE